MRYDTVSTYDTLTFSNGGFLVRYPRHFAYVALY
jgi:hypothetical protein